MSKQECTTEGQRQFERIEKALDKLVRVWANAHDEGMIDDICELHSLQNETLAIKYAVLGLHCRGTHIAQRNACDVAPPADDGGPVVQGGGGGR